MENNGLIKDWTAIIVSVISLIGTITVMLKSFIPTKKEKAEMSVADASAATAWEKIAANSALRIAEMNRRIDELEKQMDALLCYARQLERRLLRWKAGISLLVSQLVSLNQTPVWQPPAEETEPLGDKLNEFSNTDD